MSKTHQATVNATPRDAHLDGLADVRLQISELGSAIVELRAEADRLLQSATARESAVFLRPIESARTPPQHAVSDAAPVWPRLDPHEPQHGAGDSPATDSAFGAQATPPETGTDATVLEFAPRQASGESDSAVEPTYEDTARTPSQGMPADWNTAGDDDAAIEKFFSAEVEPEPAQRWLLND